MDWFQVLVIVFGNAAWTVPMWLWSRSETRADHRQLENAMNANLSAIREDIKIFQEAFNKETKEFHARLCVIEAKNKGK